METLQVRGDMGQYIASRSRADHAISRIPSIGIVEPLPKALAGRQVCRVVLK